MPVWVFSSQEDDAVDSTGTVAPLQRSNGGEGVNHSILSALCLGDG